VFEPKFDGERCLAFRKGPQVRLLSRNRKRLNGHYPELAEAWRRRWPTTSWSMERWWPSQAVAAASPGCSGACRSAIPKRPAAAGWRSICTCLYLFDVLYVNGCDVTRLGLRQRKAALAIVPKSW
jgi:bifunctional non-homologous end joining protein LigD